jgi:hypothetical protein
MRTNDTTIARLLVGGMLGLGLVGAGCHSSSDGQGKLLAAGTVAALGSDLSALPPGTIPGVPSGSPALLEGPQVDIVSPARASYTTSRKVTVEGVVTDLGGGISDVRVAGRKVTPDASGAFREEVDLEPGMNTVAVEAWDTANHKRERFVNVVAGDLAPEADVVADAATSRITEAAFDLIEPSITQGIEAQRAQIVAQVLATRLSNDDTKIKGFTFGAVRSGVDCVPGGVTFSITIENLAMEIEHKAKVLLVFSTTKRGTVRAQRLEITGVTQVSVTAGQPVTRVVQVTATAQGFSVPDWASGEYANIKRGFENGFAASAAAGIGDGLTKALRTTSGTIAPPAGTQGPPVSIDWTMSTLAFDQGGATATFSANARTPQATVGTETRSFVIKNGLANLTGGAATGPNVALAVHQDLLNRSLHAAWRGGAMNITLDQAMLARVAPQSPLRLDTSGLIALAPELAAVVAPGLPIELVIEGQLPTVVKLRAGPLPHLLDIGALKVTTVVLDPVKGRTVLGEASYAVRAEVTMTEKQGKLVLGAGQVEVHVDALGAPQAGAEMVLEKMATQLGPQLLTMALAGQQGVALPAVQGVSLSNLQVQALDGNLIILGTAAAPAPAP